PEARNLRPHLIFHLGTAFSRFWMRRTSAGWLSPSWPTDPVVVKMRGASDMTPNISGIMVSPCAGAYRGRMSRPPEVRPATAPPAAATAAAEVRVVAARLVQVAPALGRVRLLEHVDEDLSLGHGTSSPATALTEQCEIGSPAAQKNVRIL